MFAPLLKTLMTLIKIDSAHWLISTRGSIDLHQNAIFICKVWHLEFLSADHLHIRSDFLNIQAVGWYKIA